MIITYIHHSCFCIEFDDVVMIFDYYKGELPSFDTNKSVYVFASHKHQDHFDKSIFNLANDYTKITFILSNDIRMNESYMNRNNISEIARTHIIYVGKNDTLHLPQLLVETLTSTDQGVAFIVTYQDQVLYHAGDLNWWTWQGETEKEYKDMTNRFLNEMAKLKGRTFDVAFLPLDPRQEDRFWWGFHNFMKTTFAKNVFPMHFWMDYSVIRKLKNREEAAEYADRVIELTKEGQKFIINEKHGKDTL